MSHDELVPNHVRSDLPGDSVGRGCSSCLTQDSPRLEREQVELRLTLLGGQCSIILSTLLLPAAIAIEWHAKSHGYATPINEMVWGALLSPFAGAAWVKLRQKLPWGKK